MKRKHKNREYILIVDDNSDLHQDYAKIILLEEDKEREALELMESDLFGHEEVVSPKIADLTATEYLLHSAYQGQDGIDRVKQAEAEDKPYSLIFMDIRMPPGIDGVCAAKEILDITKNTQIVLCSAYSDYPWSEIVENVGLTDRILFLEKPFQAIEVQQIVLSLTTKFRKLNALDKQHQELVLQKDKAEIANNAKDAFLANMGHEIRTPLTTIMGYAEKMKDDKDSAEESLEIILSSADHLLNVVNDILDLTKIETGSLDLDYQQVNIYAVLANIFETMQEKANKQGIDFNLDVQLPLPKTINCDSTRISQVLYNLVDNAIKFTPKGDVTLRISHNFNEEVITISVEDTGIGMTEEQQQKVFKPFTQADVSITRQYGGTGLGLNIAQKIVENLSGSLNLESSLDQGSKFTISLPTGSLSDIAICNSVEELQKDVSESANELLKYSGKVLLVEDSESSRKLISFFV